MSDKENTNDAELIDDQSDSSESSEKTTLTPQTPEGEQDGEQNQQVNDDDINSIIKDVTNSNHIDKDEQREKSRQGAIDKQSQRLDNLLWEYRDSDEFTLEEAKQILMKTSKPNETWAIEEAIRGYQSDSNSDQVDIRSQIRQEMEAEKFANEFKSEVKKQIPQSFLKDFGKLASQYKRENPNLSARHLVFLVREELGINPSSNGESSNPKMISPKSKATFKGNDLSSVKDPMELSDDDFEKFMKSKGTSYAY